MIQASPNRLSSKIRLPRLPAIGTMLWLLWRRHRAEMSVLLVLMAAIRVLTTSRSDVESAFGYILYLPMLGLWFIFQARLANGDSDWLGDGNRDTNSAYPRFMLTLPISDGWMVSVPMLFAALSTALTFFLARLLIWPTTNLGLLIGSAAYVCAITLCLQTISWSHIRGRYTKIIVASIFLFVATVGVITFLEFLSLDRQGSVQTYQAYAGFGLISLLVVFPAFARARHRYPSRFADRERSKPQSQRSKGRAWPRFRSPVQALVWTGWRRQGIVLPIVTVVLSLLYAAIQTPHQIEIAQRLAQARAQGIILKSSEVDRIYLTREWTWDDPTILVTLVIFAALIIGAAPRKVDVYNANVNLTPFIGVRPISGLDYVLAQFRISLKSSLWATAIIVLALIAAAHFWGVELKFFNLGISQTLGLNGFGFFGPTGYSFIVAVTFWIALLFFSIWNFQTLMLATELSGRRALSYFPLLAPFIILVGGYAASNSEHDYGPSFCAVIWLLLAGKICATFLSGATLRRRGQISDSALTAIVLGWLICVYGLALGLTKFYPTTLGLGTIVPAAALLVPLARFLVAPIMFEWNRHR